jgi:L-amino acid N-acyltransferase YncA
MANLNLRDARDDDASSIVAIYNPYVRDTAISFEEAPVTVDEMAQRIRKVRQAGLPWLVAEHEGVLVGYAYATRWRERHAYRFTVECTVYAAADFQGRGVGAALYGTLFPRLRDAGCHAVVAVIVLPNPTSIGLHERFGMRKVAHFPEVGHKFGRWHDVGNWQVVLGESASQPSGSQSHAS